MFHIWSLELVTEAERSRKDRKPDTTRHTRAIVLVRDQPINQFELHLAVPNGQDSEVMSNRFRRMSVSN